MKKLEINKNTEKKILLYLTLIGCILTIIPILNIIFYKYVPNIIPKHVIGIMLIIGIPLLLAPIYMLYCKFSISLSKIYFSKDERVKKIRNTSVYYSSIITGISMILLKYLIIPLVVDIPLKYFVIIIINIFVINSIIIYYFLNKKGDII